MGAIPHVPGWGVVAGAAVGGAAMAALTPSIMPRSSKDRMILAGGGAVLGAAAGGAALGALRLFKSPLGNAYGPVKTALAAAAILGSAAVVATHWGPQTVVHPAPPTYSRPGLEKIETIEEQQHLPAKPGTSSDKRDVMDARGLRFLDTIMTGLKEQPVRVYAGLGTGDTPEARVRFAIDEMKKLGAFDKSKIIIAQPSGSGFVNQVPIQTAEMLADGDIATVALQYGNSRSFSVDSMVARNVAIEQHRMMIEAVHREIEKLPADKRPELYLYGESLGGWTAQDAVTKDGIKDMDELGIKRALWVGTPGLSHWSERVPAENAVRITDYDQLQSMDSSDIEADDRVVEFRNPNDAVTKLDPRMLWSKPDWVGKVNPDQAWIPGISFLQTGLDTYNAIAASQPGVFGHTAHDYRLVHAKAIQLAYDFPDVGADRLAQIQDTTRELEQEYFATHSNT